jgi:hypothetical protein
MNVRFIAGKFNFAGPGALYCISFKYLDERFEIPWPKSIKYLFKNCHIKTNFDVQYARSLNIH